MLLPSYEMLGEISEHILCVMGDAGKIYRCLKSCVPTHQFSLANDRPWRHKSLSIKVLLKYTSSAFFVFRNCLFVVHVWRWENGKIKQQVLQKVCVLVIWHF